MTPIRSRLVRFVAAFAWGACLPAAGAADRLIPFSAFGQYAVPEPRFRAIAARIEDLYRPEFAKRGWGFRILADWRDDRANAAAERDGTAAVVRIRGGFARHPRLTVDAFALALCHEVGHHLGGAPKAARGLLRADWATTEAGADYFATLKCARALWREEDNAGVLAARFANRGGPPRVVTERCQKSFDSREEIALCERSALAGRALAEVLADLAGTRAPDFETPEPPRDRTSRADADHPSPQCRLDTLFAGALCRKPWTSPVSERDPDVAGCAVTEPLGARPGCGAP